MRYPCSGLTVSFHRTGGFRSSGTAVLPHKNIQQWEGSLEILQRGNPCEAELCARGSRFHLIVGKHSYGNYLCIPNWDVGTELSSLTDLFWNEERLRHYSRMKKADACTIVLALKVLAEHGCMN